MNNKKLNELFLLLDSEIKSIKHRELKDEIKDLNDRLYNLVYGLNIDYDYNFFSNQLSKVLIKHYGKKEHNEYTNYKKMSEVESLTLVEHFFNTLPGRYTNLLDDYLNEHKILFTPELENKVIYNDFEMDNTTFYNSDPDFINISYTGTIQDSSALVHELMHFTNSNINDESVSSEFLTEAFSTFMELCYYDFLDSNYPEYKSSTNALRRDHWFYNLYICCIENYIFSCLYEEISNGKYINTQTLIEIINNLQQESSIPKTFLNELLEDVLYTIKVSIPLYDEKSDLINLSEMINNYSGYTIALAIAIYMYDIYKEKGIVELLNINDSLKVSSINSVLDNLNLLSSEPVNESEAEVDFDKIEKTFIKYKKKLW